MHYNNKESWKNNNRVVRLFFWSLWIITWVVVGGGRIFVYRCEYLWIFFWSLWVATALFFSKHGFMLYTWWENFSTENGQSLKVRFYYSNISTSYPGTLFPLKSDIDLRHFLDITSKQSKTNLLICVIARLKGFSGFFVMITQKCKRLNCYIEIGIATYSTESLTKNHHVFKRIIVFLSLATMAFVMTIKFFFLWLFFFYLTHKYYIVSQKCRTYSNHEKVLFLWCNPCKKSLTKPSTDNKLANVHQSPIDWLPFSNEPITNPSTNNSSTTNHESISFCSC